MDLDDDDNNNNGSDETSRSGFHNHCLNLGIPLGTGCFGRVYKAHMVDTEGKFVQTIAVKMVRSNSNPAAVASLIRELEILSHLESHVNVVTLIGVSSEEISITNRHIYILYEYCRFGNLHTYLVKHHNTINATAGDELRTVPEFPVYANDIAEMSMEDAYVTISRKDQLDFQISLSSDHLHSNNDKKNDCCHQTAEGNSNSTFNQDELIRDLICLSYQIARGMNYLSSKNIIHGDLAARNILLADFGVAKVSDFGMARKIAHDENCYRTNKDNELLPLKWMAIESLKDGIFSSQSDVWSYGILLWEMFTLGQVPYPGMKANYQLIDRLQNGYRMGKPDYAPDSVGQLMSNCWKPEPNERPTFKQLEDITGGYLEPPLHSYYLIAVFTTITNPHNNKEMNSV